MFSGLVYTLYSFRCVQYSVACLKCCKESVYCSSTSLLGKKCSNYVINVQKSEDLIKKILIGGHCYSCSSVITPEHR